jgi:Flp pilus assembly protein TadG
LENLAGAIVVTIRRVTSSVGFVNPLKAFRRKSRRAQALMELAIILPGALLILVGIVDLGRVFYTTMALHEAAGSGALAATNWQKVTDQCTATPPIDTCATQTVANIIMATGAPQVSILQSEIVFTPNNAWSGSGAWATNQTFTITINHTFHFITPILSSTKTLPLRAVINGQRNP